jgi:hypothetical protein
MYQPPTIAWTTIGVLLVVLIIATIGYLTGEWKPAP